MPAGCCRKFGAPYAQGRGSIAETEFIMFKNGMRPVHPGEILVEDYIKPMGLSVHAVALALHVPYSRLSEITRGSRDVSADTALRLEVHFGSEAQGWLNLQSAFDLCSAERI